MQFRIEFAADAVARDRGHEHVGVTVLVNHKEREKKKKVPATKYGEAAKDAQDDFHCHDA
jgi:hypothetical protein